MVNAGRPLPGKQKPKLLVVDDEPDNLDLLYRSFYREFQVLRANSGFEALDILEAQQDIAVIISDQRMPGMSGTEFLSRTATQYPNIIRIILTGYTDVEDLVEAINEGRVFKYVTKPWDDEDLKTVVRQALDTHKVLKARTEDLNRTLRQETLLNAVTNTIRSAPTSQHMLQTIVDTVGPMLEISLCLLQSVADPTSPSLSIYRSNQIDEAENALNWDAITLRQTIWETPEVTVINDISELDLTTPDWQIRSPFFQAADICSTLIIPLLYKQELMAVLALHQCGKSRVWEGSEVQLLITMAEQAALALAQTWTYERVQALARRESLVNTITQAIRSSLNPQDIFAAITHQLGQAMGADGCALSLWTATDEFVQCVGLYAADQLYPTTVSTPEAAQSLDLGDPPVDQLPQSIVPIAGNPVLQQMLLTLKPVVIHNLIQQPDLAMHDLPLRAPAQALLVVPLIVDGHIIGSISLRQTQTPRQWQPDEIDLAEAVAAQAAIAVQQARLYEKTRQQAEQLLALDRQKTEFFQNISHEFRTPLTLTIGPLESAVARGEGLDYEQSAIALRNSRRLLRLVNQLLDLQRLDAGRMQATFRPCNPVAFVQEVVEAFKPYCDRKHLSLQASLQACPDLYLDLEKFDKVLYNLLSNAMKFTPAGGQISVSLEAQDRTCILTVKDTGIGIRADQLPHLFERFRQADGSTNRSYEGSGLGLALVKELVELHGGHVTVESTYGSGTTFQIHMPFGKQHLPADHVADLPAELESRRAAIELADVEIQTVDDGSTALSFSDPHPVEAEDESDVLDQFGNFRILVVDDNPDLRSYVSGILKRRGYRVKTAANGALGLAAARANTPDLIITDLMMPEVSGLELIQQARADETLSGIPIILLTAKADSETRIEGAEQGADAYLSKPFNDRELLAEVRNLLALKANERRIVELNTYLTESVLKRFLPKTLVDKAARGNLQLDLSPEPRLITILFSDIIGFTQMSNTLQSERIAALLNTYLEAMTHAIFEAGGTVDKFMGDAVLALFGAPEECSPEDQVSRAITAARGMYRALDVLNERWVAQGLGQVQFRCGIHQGMAVVGMFGNSERSDYTAIGPSVNVAARLQEAADPDCILVSEEVARYLPPADLVRSVSLELKGIDQPVMTYGIRTHVD